MFYSAGILFCGFLIYASSNKLSCEENMAFIDFLCNFLTYIGQMKKTIFICCQKATIPQNTYCMADTWLRYPHLTSNIHRTSHTVFALYYQHSLQIILT